MVVVANQSFDNGLIRVSRRQNRAQKSLPGKVRSGDALEPAREGAWAPPVHSIRRSYPVK